MKIEQLYTGCLSEAAYYIESDGEAAIVDPLRETDPYIKMAEENASKIKYIFETHFHADFVSGHVDLANKTGAEIVYGPNAKTEYETHVAVDGEEFKIGKLTMKVLHTPGHTLESTTYLLKDENGKDHAIFSGDTLFIGDVGRPDLAVKSDLSQEDLAGLLYDSLHNKIMPLADDVIVYPAHGAGSACGKNMSKETYDTLGNQKQVNYALDTKLSREEFIQTLTEGIMPAPQYFAKNARLNMTGYDEFDAVMQRGNRAYSVDKFKSEADKGVLIIDTRPQQVFNKAFVPGSVNIPLDGSFAVWVGTLIQDIEQPILIVAPENRIDETIMRMARVGYDHVIGYLEGGLEAWKAAGMETESITSISPVELLEKMKQGDVQVVDVRKPSEYEHCHIPDAINYPLDFINQHADELPKDKTLYMHCAGGYRSMIAASILRKRGYTNIIDIAGGMGEIKKTDIPRVEAEMA